MKLSREEWLIVREQWELSPKTGYQWLSEALSVSRPAVAKQARLGKWTKRARLPVKIGRPTKYHSGMVSAINDYFREIDAYIVLIDPDNPYKKKIFPCKPKTLVGFAASIKIDRSTLHKWANSRNDDGELLHPEFHYAYKNALNAQECMLIEGGLAGVYHAGITMFMLKNHHGFKSVVNPEADFYISKKTEADMNRLYELRLSESRRLQATLEGRFERITGKKVAVQVTS